MTTRVAHHRAVEHLMTELGALAVTFRNAGDEPVLEPAVGTIPLWPELKVIGLFPENADPQLLEYLLNQRLPAGSIQGYRHRPLEDQIWERAWLKDFAPQTFGGRLCICPSHCRPPAEIPAVVFLDPGLAFGTGTHATTWLCLQHLATSDLRGRRLIDFGCGSGILALAALRLGAAEVWAVDNDPQALAATRANAERNHIDEGLKIVPAGEPIGEQADVVVANILAAVLRGLVDTLSQLTGPGARLVLSGILSDQVSEVRQAYEPRFGRWQLTEREDWALLCGRKS